MEINTHELEGTTYRSYRTGSGPAVLLLHGIGPGTSIPANFQPLIDRLSPRFTVHGIDLIGFGGSGRKATPPYFDFPLWTRQAAHYLSIMASPPAGLVGQSLGGALALRLAAAQPGIGRVVLTGTGGGPLRLNRYLDAFWRFPRSREELRQALLGTFFDPAAVTDAVVAQRHDTLVASGIGPYFDAMMAEDKQAHLDSALVPISVLRKVGQPVLMVHGRHDLPCPAEESALPMSRDLDRCDIVLLARCGHNPVRERPAEALALIEDFLSAGSSC